MQFSIRTLLAYTVLVAVGCYAVMYPSDWLRVTITCLQVPVAAGAVATALLATGRRRAFWMGFASMFLCSYILANEEWRGSALYQLGTWQSIMVIAFISRITLATVAGLVTQVIYARAAKRSEQA